MLKQFLILCWFCDPQFSLEGKNLKGGPLVYTIVVLSEHIVWQLIMNRSADCCQSTLWEGKLQVSNIISLRIKKEFILIFKKKNVFQDLNSKCIAKIKLSKSHLWHLSKKELKLWKLILKLKLLTFLLTFENNSNLERKHYYFT